jgi:hypothetical protein
MWHPHLKKIMDENNSMEVFDNRKRIFPASLSLLQLGGGNFLQNTDQGHPKMQCGCRFLKQDQIQSPVAATNINNNANLTPVTSLLEIENNTGFEKINQNNGKYFKLKFS